MSKLRDDAVEDIRLEIYEPPRLFEALLRGRALEDVPDITARICGICPVAYQMSTVHALEAALGVAVSPEIRRLRRLLYCGEWIESHGLHIYLLNAPDFLGFESGLEMAESFPDEVNRGLRMKKHGNALLETLGGRAIHPISVAVGGFYGAPRREEVQRLIPDFQWCLQAAVETTRWVAGFDFPDFDCNYQLVSLGHDDEYPMNEGRVVTSNGESIAVEDYENEFEERQVEHSTALHSLRKQTGATYFVGPLARVSLNLDRLSPTARTLADEVGVEWPCFNPFQSIIARGLEMVHAYEEAIDIMRDYQPPRPTRVAYSYQAGAGCAATEAPRGLLYHRYAVDAEGKICEAKIVPPTSQNQAQIEADLRNWAPQALSGDDAAASRQIRKPCALLRSLHQLFHAFFESKDRPSMTRRSTLIVGVGSPHGDDQAGWLVAERLAADLDENDAAVRKAAAPIQVLDCLEGVERLILCDACRGLGRVGELRRWTWPAGELAGASWSGSHGLSLTATLQLAERLNRLPKQVVIWAVEAAVSGALDGLSPQVAAALPRLVGQIKAEIYCGARSRDEICTNNRSQNRCSDK